MLLVSIDDVYVAEGRHRWVRCRLAKSTFSIRSIYIPLFNKAKMIRAVGVMKRMRSRFSIVKGITICERVRERLSFC